VEERALDLLHVHYAYPHAVSAYLARLMTGRKNLPIVTTLHGTDIALVRQDESFASLTRFGIVESDAITAVSSFLRSTTRSWFGIRKPIEVIPNFVDTDRFRPRDRTSGDKGTIVHVSNFRPVKRSLDAIRALGLLRRKVDARLRMIGTGPELDEARALAGKLRVANAVEFLGEEKHIERELARADLLLSTSEFEGFGLAPLEAMACGVPVVATRAGGIAEVVEEGSTGLLVDVGDVEGLAQRMSELLTDGAMARKMGIAARDRAVRVFGTPRVVPKYERLYAKLLRSAGRREEVTAHA